MSDDGYEYDYGDDDYGGGYDYGGDGGGDAYGDAYGSGGGDAEETWESRIDNKYATAKHSIDSDPSAAEAAFLEMLAEDEAKGKWSFKAHKMLCRLYQRNAMWDKLLPAFTALLEWEHAGITKSEKEKAVTKFFDRCAANVIANTMLLLYEDTLRVLGAKHESLWFTCKFRQAQILMGNKEGAAAERALRRLADWGTAGTADAALRKGPQLLQVYALLLQLYIESERFDKVQEVFAKASANETMVGGSVRASIYEAGAQMYMQQGAWEKAHRHFTEAFHKYDESGDPRRIRALKALVVATMLAKRVSDHIVNPFDAPEAAAYRTEGEIVAISALIDAAERKDAARFDAVLADPQNRRAIYGDKAFFKYLEPLISAFRMVKLQALCAPFTQVRLSYLAAEMNITEAEAEQLCVQAILEGSVDGLLDQPSGSLMLPEPMSSDADRSSALGEWSRQMATRFEAVSDSTRHFLAVPVEAGGGGRGGGTYFMY